VKSDRRLAVSRVRRRIPWVRQRVWLEQVPMRTLREERLLRRRQCGCIACG